MTENTKKRRQTSFERQESALASMKENATISRLSPDKSELEKELDRIKTIYLTNNLYFTEGGNADKCMYCMNDKIFVIHIPKVLIMYLEHAELNTYLVTVYSSHNIKYSPRDHKEYIVTIEDLMEKLYVSIPQEKIYIKSNLSTHFNFSTLVIKEDIPEFIKKTLDFLIFCERDANFKQREAELYKLTFDEIYKCVNPYNSVFECQLNEIKEKYFTDNTKHMYVLNSNLFVFHVENSMIIYVEHVERSYYVVTMFSNTSFKYKHDMCGFAKSEYTFLDDISDAGLLIPIARSYFDKFSSTHYSFSTYTHEKYIPDVLKRLLDQL